MRKYRLENPTSQAITAQSICELISPYAMANDMEYNGDFMLPREFASELPEPCICGGAARDIHLGKPVKDYDIFYPVYRPILVDMVACVYEMLSQNREEYGYRMSVNGTDRGYQLNAYCRPEMLGNIHLILPETDVDIVFFDAEFGTTPQEIVGTFDNSLSKCWIADGELHLTSEFERSVQKKTIWTYSDVPTRASHIMRVVAKYPDFKLEIPSEKLRAEIENTFCPGEVSNG